MSSKYSESDIVVGGVGCSVAVILVVVLTVMAYLLNGWVLSILWGWFAVTIFGVKALSIPEAIGIAMVVGFLTNHTYKTTKNENDKPDWGAIVGIWVSPFITLSAGWIVYTYFLVH